MWGWDCKVSMIAKENCALKCLSPRCYELVYGSDPVRVISCYLLFDNQMLGDLIFRIPVVMCYPCSWKKVKKTSLGVKNLSSVSIGN